MNQLGHWAIVFLGLLGSGREPRGRPARPAETHSAGEESADPQAVSKAELRDCVSATAVHILHGVIDGDQ